NLRPHCFGEGNRVEHFSDFGGFCSTFEAARAGFEESGRQKRVIFPVFCLLWLSQSLDSDENYEKAVPSMTIGVLKPLGSGQCSAFFKEKNQLMILNPYPLMCSFSIVR
ncbi:MAG: hypothetical protein UE077_03315, partial [Ligilactobacillus ruminis]|nr:hypothetical protein [Ligilactobacillus ruminis]